MRRRKERRRETEVSCGMEFRECRGSMGLKLRHHGDYMSRFKLNLKGRKMLNVLFKSMPNHPYHMVTCYVNLSMLTYYTF